MICKNIKKFETCPSVTNILCGKSVSLVQILFDDSLKLSPTAFHVLDFIATSFKPDNLLRAIYRVCGLRLDPKFEVGPAAKKNLYLLLTVEKHTFAVFVLKNLRPHK